MKQRMRKYSDTLQRTIIRSPVRGVVKTLYFVTIGGVVKSGDVIVDIVPMEDRLVVEAHLPIQDIGYVQPGQDAVVKLASRDAGRFGKLEGEVIHVSPDTFTTQEGATFYSVRIVTGGDSFKRGNFEYKLIPGMLVTAYIHTGERTVLDYLLDPFMDSLDQAMKER
jgi:adhesin transport system membrane fusion protein